LLLHFIEDGGVFFPGTLSFSVHPRPQHPFTASFPYFRMTARFVQYLSFLQELITAYHHFLCKYPGLFSKQHRSKHPSQLIAALFFDQHSQNIPGNLYENFKREAPERERSLKNETARKTNFKHWYPYLFGCIFAFPAI